MKKRFDFKKFTIIHCYWVIIVCVLVYSVGDIALARYTGSYIPATLNFDRVETVRYEGYGTGRVNYTKLEEEFLKSLKENGAHPAMRDLLMFGLKFYEMSDARMRYVLENEDVINDVALDYFESFQEDYKQGLTVRDHTEQFMEDLAQTLDEKGAPGEMIKSSPQEIAEQLKDDITNIIEGE